MRAALSDGATRTSVTAWCQRCGWSLLRSVTELRPIV